MKIFLAGTTNQDTIRSRALYVLDTFFFINPKKPSDHARFKDYILDSGLFSMMNSGKNVTSWDQYLERYADYVKTNKIQHYVELDADKFVGYQNVLKMRKRLEALVGWPCMPVWHPNRGKEEFTKMVQQYDYACLGGLVTCSIQQRNFTEKYFPLFIDEAHRNNCLLHGLGFTRTSKLDQIHFDSVDSTAWLNGAKYGNLASFNGTRIVGVNRPKNHIVDLPAKERFRINGEAWLKYQRYADIYL